MCIHLIILRCGWNAVELFRKKKMNREKMLFLGDFSLSFALLSSRNTKLNLQRDSDRYSIYMRQSAANGHVRSVFARLVELDLRLDTDGQSVLISGISPPPTIHPHASFSLTRTTTTIHLTHCGETFKNLKTSRASRCSAWILHRGYYFFAMMLWIFLGVSISTNLTEAK